MFVHVYDVCDSLIYTGMSAQGDGTKDPTAPLHTPPLMLPNLVRPFCITSGSFTLLLAHTKRRFVGKGIPYHRRLCSWPGGKEGSEAVGSKNTQNYSCFLSVCSLLLSGHCLRFLRNLAVNNSRISYLVVPNT